MIGGAAATPLTILLLVFFSSLFGRCIEQGMSLAQCMSEPEKLINLAELSGDAVFIRDLIFIGGVQAGILSLIQWLLFFRQIPKTRQNLRTSCIGAWIGFVLFGLMFNFVTFLFLIPRVDETPFIEHVLPYLMMLIAAAIAGSIQGIVQSRMIAGQRAKVRRWMIVSTIGGAVSMLLVLLGSPVFFPHHF
jgi:hypothetical protein